MLENSGFSGASAGHSGIYSGAGELTAVDDAGNQTTLSPHNFSLTSPSDIMAWSFYSRNEDIGQQINVDMLKAVRLIEDVTGEKLVYQADLDGNSIDTTIDEESLLGKVKNFSEENIALKQQLEEQQKQIDELRALVEQLLRKK